MIYIERDKDGKICALHNNKSNDAKEEVESSDTEVIEFLLSNDTQERLKFLESDLQLIRVIEDLIDILVGKNIITITDFPAPVVEKLLKRQSFRKRFAGAAGMEFDSESI